MGTRPEVSLILGVLAHDGRRLMTTNLTTVTKVWNFEAVGSGSPLANFLIKRFYSGRLDVSAAAFLSAQVLMHVKRNVLRCGGRSRVLVMYHVNATAGFLQDKTVQEYEAYSERFDAAMRPVLFAGHDRTIGDDDYATKVERMTADLTTLRPMQIQQAENVVKSVVISPPTGHVSVVGEWISAVIKDGIGQGNTPIVLRDSAKQEED